MPFLVWSVLKLQQNVKREGKLTSLCASSLSWCGNMRSTPPLWTSILSPRISVAMTEHSMCQPGRPLPHGLGHDGSPGLDVFHKQKSAAERFVDDVVSDPEPSKRRVRCGAGKFGWRAYLHRPLVTLCSLYSTVVAWHTHACLPPLSNAAHGLRIQ